MNKKVYLMPRTEIMMTEVNAVLAESPGATGATGEDIPWAAKEHGFIFDNELDNDEE